jgi:hypothetical protein
MVVSIIALDCVLILTHTHTPLLQQQLKSAFAREERQYSSDSRRDERTDTAATAASDTSASTATTAADTAAVVAARVERIGEAVGCVSSGVAAASLTLLWQTRTDLDSFASYSLQNFATQSRYIKCFTCLLRVCVCHKQ